MGRITCWGREHVDFFTLLTTSVHFLDLTLSLATSGVDAKVVSSAGFAVFVVGCWLKLGSS